MPDQTMPAHIGPLTIPGLDEQYFQGNVIYDQQLLDLFARIQGDPKPCAMFLLTVLNDTDPVPKMRQRYAEISCKEYEPIVVPDHPVLINNIISPLKQAKVCYVMNMPIACIAQSGLVGEMVAIWRFQMLKFNISGKPADETAQKKLFGDPFDELHQYRRTEILRALGELDDGAYKALNELRGLRNKYLHSMVEVHQNADADARNAYKNACLLVFGTLDIKLSSEGQFLFPPRVMEYIKDIVKVSGEQAQDEQV